MIILIFFPQYRENFQSSLSTGSAAPGADRGELPGRRPGQDAPVSSSTSSPFPSLPSAGESQNEGLAIAIPAAKSHAPALDTGFRCRHPRGHRQLHPLQGPRSSSRRCPCSLWATAARWPSCPRLNCFNSGCPKSPGLTLKRPLAWAGDHSPVYRGRSEAVRPRVRSPQQATEPSLLTPQV